MSYDIHELPVGSAHEPPDDSVTEALTDPFAWIDRELPHLATLQKVAEVTGYSRSTVLRALASGDLLCIKVGRTIRIPRVAVRAWLEQGVSR